MPVEDFLSGKGTPFRVYFNNNIWNLSTKTWKVQEVSDEADDDVNGEDHTRSQLIFKYFRVTMDCYDQSTANIIENSLTSQAAERANLPATPIAGGAVFKYLDGATVKAITFKGCSRLPVDFGSSGRTQRFMYNLGFKATDCSMVAAAGF